MSKDDTKRISLCEPYLNGNEWRYVKECIDTNWVSSAGQFVNRFEDELARAVARSHGVAASSGTAALHTALLTLGIGAGDEVIVPAVTFVASVNSVKYVGATPVFIDIESAHWQLDTDKVKSFIDDQCMWKDNVLRNKKSGNRVRAIMPVHLLGHPVKMAPLIELARTYHLFIVEDATQSLGAEYEDAPVGSHGDVACFSFNGNKLITTGGGGMLVTNRADWAERAKYLTQQARDSGPDYVHSEVGYNYRMTNLQAAIGCAQLEAVDVHVKAKRDIARRYTEQLSDIAGLVLPAEAPWAASVYWLYTVRIDAGQVGVNCSDARHKLNEAGIETRRLWHPICDLAPYKDCEAYQVSTAWQVYAEALSLPSSVAMASNVAQQQTVIDEVRRILT